MRRTRPPKIAIRNRQRTLRLNLSVVRRVVREAWRITNHELRISNLESRVSNHELSLVFVTDAEITHLNKHFIGHDGATDVITFEHGEIVVSTDRAVAQAKQFHTSVAEELTLYVIHGLLHLAGYDDLKAGSRRAMHRRQRLILAAVRKKLDSPALLR